MKIFHQEVFSCAPAALFSWLAEPEKAMVWMKTVSRTEITHRTENKIGTTFSETVQDENGSVEMTGIITAYVKDRLIAFHLDSRVNSLDIAYATERTDAGTRLAVTSTIRWRFPVNVMTVFLGRKMQAGILGQLRSELSELRKLSE